MLGPALEAFRVFGANKKLIEPGIKVWRVPAIVPTLRSTAIKLRKKLPLLLERVGVRRIKIRKKALFDPLILAFSRREKGLYILNLMVVTLRRL